MGVEAGLQDQVKATSWLWGNRYEYLFSSEGIIRSKILSGRLCYAEIAIEFGIVISILVLRTDNFILAGLCTLILLAVIIARQKMSISWPISSVIAYVRLKQLSNIPESKAREFPIRRIPWSDVEKISMKGKRVSIATNQETYQAVLNGTSRSSLVNLVDRFARGKASVE